MFRGLWFRWGTWQLRSTRWETRAQGATKLGRSRDPRAVALLRAAVADRNQAVRWRAVAALDRIGGPQVVAALEAALEFNRDNYTGLEAVRALRKVATPEVVTPLLRVIGESYVGPAAAEGLGEMREVSAVDVLITALHQADTSSTSYAALRAASARALGRIGAARAVEPLAFALRDPNAEVRAAAAAGLDLLRWAPKDDTERALLAVAQKDWRQAAGIGLAAVKPLVAALKDYSVFRFAEEALAQIGGAEVVDALVFELKNEPQEAASWRWARTIQRVGGDLAGNALIAVLINDPSKSVRCHAAISLGELRDARAVPALIQALADPALRMAAVRALGEIRDTRAIEPIISTLAVHKERDEDTMCIAEALGKLGDPRSLALFVRVATRDKWNAERALLELEKVLPRLAPEAKAEDLRTVDALSGVMQCRTESDSVTEETYEIPVDCRKARRLARGELRRRGAPRHV